MQYRILFRLCSILLTRPYFFEEIHTHFALVCSILSTLPYYTVLNSVYYGIIRYNMILILIIPNLINHTRGGSSESLDQSNRVILEMVRQWCNFPLVSFYRSPTAILKRPVPKVTRPGRLFCALPLVFFSLWKYELGRHSLWRCPTFRLQRP